MIESPVKRSSPGRGNSGGPLGYAPFDLNWKFSMQICCRCSEGHNGRAARAPAPAPTLLERVIVTDKAVEAGDSVVERPRRCVVLPRRPVEPVAAALAGDR